MARVQTPAPAAQLSREPARSMTQQILGVARPAIVVTLALTILTGLAYPGIITGLAQWIFPSQANGSLVTHNGQVIASQLIGQYWTKPGYFHGRPSATNDLNGTPAPYEADNSSASNLGPTNSTLLQTVQQRVDALRIENPDTPATTPIPVDLVTASASGVDPDISVAAAEYQIPRIAKVRGMTQDAVRHLIEAHIQGRFLGIFGEPRINVLDLNLALDQRERR